MKTTFALAWLTLAVCAAALAQDSTGDRIVVPAGNSSRPRVVECHLLSGSITVKTGSGKDVIVEGDHPSTARDNPPPGMHRIGVSSRGLQVTTDDNVINVRRSPAGNGNVTITVPADTSLRLHTLSGAIRADGVHGEVEAHTMNGHVELTNISGTVTADSQNGPIKVTMDAVDASKPLAFATLNGTVDLTLPPDAKINLNVKTSHGEVYSDFEVTLGGPRAVTEKNGNLVHIRTDNTIRGAINGGGTDLSIHTLNGPVYIRKKK